MLFSIFPVFQLFGLIVQISFSLDSIETFYILLSALGGNGRAPWMYFVNTLKNVLFSYRNGVQFLYKFPIIKLREWCRFLFLENASKIVIQQVFSLLIFIIGFISFRLTTFHVLSHLGLHVLLEAHSKFLEKTLVLVGWGGA